MNQENNHFPQDDPSDHSARNGEPNTSPKGNRVEDPDDGDTFTVPPRANDRNRNGANDGYRGGDNHTTDNGHTGDPYGNNSGNGHNGYTNPNGDPYGNNGGSGYNGYTNPNGDPYGNNGGNGHNGYTNPNGGPYGNQDPYSGGNGQRPPYGSPYFTPARRAAPKSNGFAIASLVTGILSLCVCCCYGGGLVFGVLAIIFAIIQSKQTGEMSSSSIAGMICGILGTLFSIILIVFMVYAYYTGLYDQIYSETYESQIPGTQVMRLLSLLFA